MKNKMTINDVEKICDKLDSKEKLDWNGLVESLYANYIFSYAVGCVDEDDELQNVYIDKKEYQDGYSKFYEKIDYILEDCIPSIKGIQDEEELTK